MKKRPHSASGGTLFPLRVGRDDRRKGNNHLNERVTVRLDQKGYPVFKSGFYRGLRVHRVIAEAILGRILTKDEDVHHRDHNRLNFDPENLEVLGKSQHGWYSAIQHYWVPRIISEHERGQWEEWTGEKLA